MKYTMRSASVERIFFILRKRPRDHRERKTEEDSNKIACDLAVVLWSHGPKVTKIKTPETIGTERPRRPCDDAIDPCLRPHCGPRVSGSQGPKKSLPLNCNLEVLARPLVDLYPLAQ